ncbi:hypothetical protein LEM8419_00132 [Neolewinella maritima]|uniref:Uncharacterized protein n=1 Tax=Neolewinella maritima TaxID=1383882 RepID=A0ABN8EZJ2_9BACT|nr:hypothetical protein [Neolewinella maritima]CAH0998804.1 hypothetical protein LEM8419_00132 [Neolewinella maritima]
MYKLLLLPLLLLSCTQQADVRDYYFPVRELTDGLVYEYANKGTLTDEPAEYWYFLGVDRDTALYLSATQYADGMTPVQLARERITNEGVELEELFLFPPSLSGERKRVTTDIIYPRSFPFYLDDGRAVGYRIGFSPPDNPDATNYVSLDRTYQKDTTLTVMGQPRDAIVFGLTGEVSQRDPRLGDISPTFTGYEVYAEGLGLVEYYRDLGAGGTVAGKLIRRIPMADYAERFE